MIVNLNYLEKKKKTVDEYNNIYHCSIGKKPIDADYFALSEKIQMNPKASKFKDGDSFCITKYKKLLRGSFNEKGLLLSKS